MLWLLQIYSPLCKEGASQVALWLKKKKKFPCRRGRTHGFDPWLGKKLWRRKWQPTPAVLPGKPMDRGAPRATVDGIAKESDMT